MTQSPLTEPTVLASWVLGIARTIRSYGCDPEPMLREAEIDPDVLFRYGDRVSVVKTNRLWKLAVEATGDETIGLRLPDYTTHSVLYSLDVAVQVASTPREVLQCLLRYAQVASSPVRFKIVTDDGPARVVFNSINQHRATAVSMDAFIAYMISCAKRTFIDIGGFYHTIRMMRAEPLDPDRYRELLGVDVEFGAEEYSILFDPDRLDARLPTSNPEMYRRCEEMLIKYLMRMDSDDIEERVRQAVTDMLMTDDFGRAAVASRLNVSERTLCRRLKEKGGSFQQILDEVRQDGARRLLACKDVSQVEIAELLGFSETSSFIRTFKRWTGQTPGEYRSSVV